MKKKRGARTREPRATIIHPEARSRGAPLGNQNALKHGFYSAAFKAEERRLLENIPVTDLAAEIELVRVTSFRFLQALTSVQQPLDIETQLAALRAVNLSAHSIVSLLRVQVLTASAVRGAAALAEAGTAALATAGPGPASHAVPPEGPAPDQ